MAILISNIGEDVRYTLAEETSWYRSFADLKKAWETEWGKECGTFERWMWYMKKHNFILIDKEA